MEFLPMYFINYFPWALYNNIFVIIYLYFENFQNGSIVFAFVFHFYEFEQNELFELILHW